MTEKSQQAARNVLKQFLLPDCLKPQYDGMSLWELAHKVVKAAEDTDTDEMVAGIAREYEMANEQKHGV